MCAFVCVCKCALVTSLMARAYSSNCSGSLEARGELVSILSKGLGGSTLFARMRAISLYESVVSEETAEPWQPQDQLTICMCVCIIS